MSDNTEYINRLMKDLEFTNPLAEELSYRHGEQIGEVEEYLDGIGSFGPQTGVVFSCKSGEPFRRPATDDECAIIKLDWDLELSIDVAGDIPDQVAEQLAKLAHRMMRAAKRIEIAASAGEFSTEGRTVEFAVEKDGKITGVFATRTATSLHAMRHGGVWFLVEDDDAE